MRCSGTSIRFHTPGGLGRANDLPTLLDAARRLQGERDIGFVIIGSGERLAEYQAFCVEHGLDNVRFIPAVPRTEARRLLAELDLCAHLYPDDELFEGALGSKTFDYHGLGKPMIFCGRGDVATLLDETGGGVALPPGDGADVARTIVALRDDEPRRTAMGESARRWFRANVEADAMAAQLRRAMTGD
jgi:glycosyltransferase involved in cell wall biosynthesis